MKLFGKKTYFGALLILFVGLMAHACYFYRHTYMLEGFSDGAQSIPPAADGDSDSGGDSDTDDDTDDDSDGDVSNSTYRLHERAVDRKDQRRGASTFFDHYNHFSGDSAGLPVGTVLYAKEKNITARIITDQNGHAAIEVILPGDDAATVFRSTASISGEDDNKPVHRNTVNDDVYYGPQGGSAQVTRRSRGRISIDVTTPRGDLIRLRGTGQAQILPRMGADDDDTAAAIHRLRNPSGKSSATQYFGATGTEAPKLPKPIDGSDRAIPNNPYLGALPPGIPRNEIPAGEEDLYILKTAIIPPVCPACPNVIVPVVTGGSPEPSTSSSTANKKQAGGTHPTAAESVYASQYAAFAPTGARAPYTNPDPLPSTVGDISSNDMESESYPTSFPDYFPYAYSSDSSSGGNETYPAPGTLPNKPAQPNIGMYMRFGAS